MIFGKRILAAAAAVVCIGTAGGLVQAEDQIGQGISIEGIDVSGMTYDEAKSVVQQKVSDMMNSTIKVQINDESVDASAVDFGLQWKNRNVVQEAVDIGNSGNAIKRYKDSKDLTQAKKDLQLEFAVNDSAVKEFVEKCKQYDQDPVEASIESDGSGGINMQPGQAGIVVNVDESVQILEDYIANNWTGAADSSVELSVQVQEPSASEKDLESITDVLGTYTTYYGSTYGRNTNVERGAELINGHLIRPGESFSVCDHLVPFSAENGYELGGAYENGRVVQEYGGGICQVSTTLYNALLLAEIEIDERHNHTMSVHYVPPSMDAAIAEGSMDLVFTNNLDTPIFISGYAYGGVLTFTVWGKEYRPEDRYVSYEGVETSTIPAPTTTLLYADNEQNVGYFNQVQTASPGSTAVCYKYVTYNGETTQEQINSSTYEAASNIYEVGTIGASDALLTAIANGDLAAAQLAATGTVTIDTNATEADDTQQSESSAQTDGSTDTSGGTYMDTTDGEVWIDNGGTTDDGVVSWE
ncbi:MAG: VanW family protein [Lachnospiraceae bacterium]|nr:VanW family protein [Lachnospiraceae bacterium]